MTEHTMELTTSRVHEAIGYVKGALDLDVIEIRVEIDYRMNYDD